MNPLLDHSNQDATHILRAIADSTEAVARKEPGAREAMLELSHQLTAALETPSETIQRIGWAEVCKVPSFGHCIEKSS